MRVKANVSFAGAVTMYVGEIRDVAEGEILNDLLAASYVQPCENAPEKAVKKNESKRNKA